MADLITIAGEEVDFSRPYRCVDPLRPWKAIVLENCTARNMRNLVIRNGERLYETEDLAQIAGRVRRQLKEEIWQEEQRFENPHGHYLDMSPSYYQMKMQMLNRSAQEENT